MGNTSPVIETLTSFSRTPGRSQETITSSLVSYTSTTGADTRSFTETFVGRPENASNSRFISAWTLPRLPNCSHLERAPKGYQRPTAICDSSLCFQRRFRSSSGYESIQLISYESTDVK